VRVIFKLNKYSFTLFIYVLICEDLENLLYTLTIVFNFISLEIDCLEVIIEKTVLHEGNLYDFQHMSRRTEDRTTASFRGDCVNYDDP